MLKGFKKQGGSPSTPSKSASTPNSARKPASSVPCLTGSTSSSVIAGVLEDKSADGLGQGAGEDFVKFAQEKLKDPTLSNADRMSLLMSLAKLQAQQKGTTLPKAPAAVVPLAAAKASAASSSPSVSSSSSPSVSSSPRPLTNSGDGEPAKPERSGSSGTIKRRTKRQESSLSNSGSSDRRRSRQYQPIPRIFVDQKDAKSSSSSSSSSSSFVFEDKTIELLDQQPRRLFNSYLLKRNEPLLLQLALPARSTSGSGQVSPGPAPDLRRHTSCKPVAAPSPTSLSLSPSSSLLPSSRHEHRVRDMQMTFRAMLSDIEKSKTALQPRARARQHTVVITEEQRKAGSRIVLALIRKVPPIDLSSLRHTVDDDELLQAPPPLRRDASSSSSSLPAAATAPVAATTPRVSKKAVVEPVFIDRQVHCTRVSALGPAVEPLANVAQLFAAAVDDAASGTLHSGLFVFVIRNLLPHCVHPSSAGDFELGVFSSRECYIVLDASSSSPPRIFYWIGEHSTADKRASVAFRAVQLSRLCRGARHIREEQGDESPALCELLGCSAVRHSEAAATPVWLRHVGNRLAGHCRLFYTLHGAERQLQLSRSSSASAQQCTPHACLVVDDGSRLWLWNGVQSSAALRYHAAQLAQEINHQERGSTAAIVVVRPDNDADTAEFQSFFTGNHSSSSSALPNQRYVLVRVQPTVQVVHDQPWRPSRRLLHDDNDGRQPRAFLLLHGDDYYVWATDTRTARAVDTAGLATYTAGRSLVARQQRGSESAWFKLHFADWSTRQQQTSPAAPTPPTPSVQWCVDDATPLPLGDELECGDDLLLGDDGPAPSAVAVFLYSAKDTQLAQVPTSLYGHFYADSAFVVVEVAATGSDEPEFFVYFHQGRGQPAASWTRFLIAVRPTLVEQIRDKAGSTARVHVRRVLEGLEPPRFLRLFGGVLVLHRGACPPLQAETAVVDGPRLYVWKELDGGRACVAVEVEAQQEPECRNHLLALFAGQQAWVMHGAQSEVSNEEAMGKLNETLFHHHHCRELVVLQERHEPAAEQFWRLVAQRPAPAVTWPAQSYPRLFRMQTRTDTGALVLRQLSRLCQHALAASSPFLLDVYDALLLRLPPSAQASDAQCAVATALAEAYRSAVAAARSNVDVQLHCFRAGHEPDAFTAQFVDWRQRADFTDPRIAIEQQHRQHVEQCRQQEAKEDRQHEKIIGDIVASIPKSIDFQSFHIAAIDFDPDTDAIIDRLLARSAPPSASVPISLDADFLNDCLTPVVSC